MPRRLVPFFFKRPSNVTLLCKQQGQEEEEEELFKHFGLKRFHNQIVMQTTANIGAVMHRATTSTFSYVIKNFSLFFSSSIRLFVQANKTHTREIRRRLFQMSPFFFDEEYI